MLIISPTLSIQRSELQEEFIRASGPGGQNVNKVATAVQLRFDVTNSSSLPNEIKTRLLHLAAGYINKEGILTVTAKRYRTQERNRKEAVRKLVGLIRQAAQKPKTHKKTRVPWSSKQNRLESKKRRGMIKSTRRSVRGLEE